MNRAGMNSQWVISAHIPKVERKPSKRDVASKTKIVLASKEEDENDLLKNIESIYEINDNPSSKLLEVQNINKCEFTTQVVYHFKFGEYLLFKTISSF